VTATRKLTGSTGWKWRSFTGAASPAIYGFVGLLTFTTYALAGTMRAAARSALPVAAPLVRLRLCC
jgi:hypothetical protein